MSKRTEERTPTLLPARIVFGNSTIECVVRDISARGARLGVSDPDAVPPIFELVVKQMGTCRPAKVRWKRRREIGVAFTTERRVFGRRLVTPGPS